MRKSGKSTLINHIELILFGCCCCCCWRSICVHMHRNWQMFRFVFRFSHTEQTKARIVDSCCNVFMTSTRRRKHSNRSDKLTDNIFVTITVHPSWQCLCSTHIIWSPFDTLYEKKKDEAEKKEWMKKMTK